jgi:hypothetical protein
MSWNGLGNNRMMRWVGRTALSILGGAVLLGTAWWAVGDAERAARIRQLEQDKAELQQVVTRLKTDRRVAQLYVSKQTKDASGNVLTSTLDFKEFDRDGSALPVRTVTVTGDVVYVDALVVRFTDDYVERGDALRGHSLQLFRRIFGENQPPSQGEALDRPKDIPEVYRTQSHPDSFERQLWKRFWDYAASPDAAAKLGVRVAQGEAVYQRVREGQLWRLATRADGGLEFAPDQVDPLIRAHLPGAPVAAPQP